METIKVAHEAKTSLSISLTIKILLDFMGVEKRNSSSGVRKNVVTDVTMPDIKSIMKNVENITDVRRCAMLYPISGSDLKRKTYILRKMK